MSSRPVRRSAWWRPVVVCVLYLAGWLALDAVAALFQSRSEVSLWYPPTGVTFALLLVFGVRYTPVLLLTDVLHGLLITDPRVGWWSVVLRGLLGTAVYGGAAAVLLHRVRIDPRLVAQRDVIWFLALACLGAPLVVAVVQVVQYDLVGLLSWRTLPIDVFGFWSGTATGVGMLCPALLVAARRWPRLWPGLPALPTAPGRSGWRRQLEIAGQVGLLLVAVFLAFGPPSQDKLDLASLVYLPLLWIAVREGLPGAVLAVLATNVLAVALVGTVVREDPLRLQLGLMTMTLAGLALGALVTQRRADVTAARHAAVHDPLTGLANRLLLMDRIGAAVQRHARDPHARPALLYCDLDGFKGVNDALGHDAGDQLLISVARRLEQTVRPGDLVGRLGGDELVVLLDGIDDNQVAVVADRAVVALREPHRIDGGEVLASASVGVALLGAAASYGSNAHEVAESLLQAGDAALQKAKRAGGNRVELFSRPLHEQARDRLALHSALRRAVARQEIGLAYQPIVALPGRDLVAVEALARWQDPDRGTIDPRDFIAAAEHIGLIHDLGRHLLEIACAQLAQWQATGAPAARIAVNVSTRQLLAGDFASYVLATLHRHALSPGDLELEITESSAVGRDGPAAASLRELSSAGVRLAIDDFGTGWSSFQALRDLAPQTLKIDRSFVTGLGVDQPSTAIVQAVLAMARHLGMTVTAEGVETSRQLALLHRLRCPQVQGFHVAAPTTAEHLTWPGTHLNAR